MNIMVQHCGKCGQNWFDVHFCPALHQPNNDVSKEARALTEADVRRIVREELERFSLVDERDPR